MWWTITILKYATAIATAVSGIIASIFELTTKTNEQGERKKLNKWGKVNLWILLCSAPAALVLQGLRDVNDNISDSHRMLVAQMYQADTLKEIERAVYPLPPLFITVHLTYRPEHKPATMKGHVLGLRNLSAQPKELDFSASGYIGSRTGRAGEDADLILRAVSDSSDLESKVQPVTTPQNGIAVDEIDSEPGTYDILAIFECRETAVGGTIASLTDLQGLPVEFIIDGPIVSQDVNLVSVGLVTANPVRSFFLERDPSRLGHSSGTIERMGLGTDRVFKIDGSIPPLSEWR
jgi:hypothetical protein